MTLKNATEDNEHTLSSRDARLTHAEIDAAILEKTFTLLPSGKCLVCEITLKNGFIFRGKSVAVGRVPFNREIAEQVSFNHARKKIWKLSQIGQERCLTVAEPDTPKVLREAQSTSLRDIKEWTDCDFVEFDFMVMLGLIDPMVSPFASKAKHVFWSANDVGTAVHEMMETFVRLGMLEKREEPDLQYRWNQEYKGTWE